jgi:LuxR family maltose regulon positive regulatory protein
MFQQALAQPAATGTLPEIRALILRAKLYHPPCGDDLVARPKLIEELQCRVTRRMTVISAPPGYGKTTLVAQWLCATDRPGAWVGLDPLDNNLETFATYMIAAVRSAYPEAGTHIHALLGAPQAVPPAILADAMVEDLAELPGPLILALDDYYEITSEDVHVFMGRLVQYLPSNIHLVLISRFDPDLPLSRMRGRGELNELHAEDLQFDTGEIQQMLARLTGSPVDGEIASELGQRTEGWAIGLQLAALARREGESAAELVARLGHEGHGYAAQFLLDEVLMRQPPAVRDLLLRTSVLARLCDPLVRAVLGADAGEEGDPAADLSRLPTVDSLSRANLFVIPLDRERVWFRYHHLFRDLLRRRLLEETPDADIRALHLRAARWFSAEGQVDEAIGHALAAGDEDMAAHLVETNVHNALDQEDWRAVARWLGLLPESLRQRPALLVARAWQLNFQFRIRAVGKTAAAAETLLPQEVPAEHVEDRAILQSEIDMLKAMAAYWAGNVPVTLSLMRRPLQLRPDMLYAKSLGDFYRAAALHSGGQLAEALSALEEALDSPHNARDTSIVRMHLCQCLIWLDRGDLPQMQRAARALGRVGARSNLVVSRRWADYAQGIIAYEWNDLPLAERHLRDVIRAPFEANGRATYESYIAMALTLEARGRREEADDALRHMHDFLVESDSAGALALVGAAHIRLAAARGESGAALPPLVPLSVEAARADLRLSWLLSPLLTRVRYHLAVGNASGLEESQTILNVSRQAAAELNDLRRLAEILALQACLDATREEIPAALDALNRSLGLAEPGRLVRTFVDCGPVLVPLLETLRDQSQLPSTIQMLLRAFKGAAAAEEAGPASKQAAEGVALMRLRSALTNREMDVLLLLEQRLSNQEIADRLFIETYTVKKHLQNIYHKLGVDNRRSAIAYARHVGLLE